MLARPQVSSSFTRKLRPIRICIGQHILDIPVSALDAHSTN